MCDCGPESEPVRERGCSPYSENQARSIFFRLPAELRNMIFDLVFGNKHIEVSQHLAVKDINCAINFSVYST
jgi:hypothetical protein